MGPQMVGYIYLDLPSGAEWMTRGAEKHYPLGFKQHPNWKMLGDVDN